MDSDSEFTDLCIAFRKYLILKGTLSTIKESSPEVVEEEFTTFLKHRRNVFARNSRSLYVALKYNRTRLRNHSSVKRIMRYEALIKDALKDAIVQDSREAASLSDDNKKRLHGFFEKL